MSNAQKSHGNAHGKLLPRPGVLKWIGLAAPKLSAKAGGRSARTQNQKPSFIPNFPFMAIQRCSKAFKAIQRFLRNYIFYFCAPQTPACHAEAFSEGGWPSASTLLPILSFCQKSAFLCAICGCLSVPLRPGGPRVLPAKNQGVPTDFRPLPTKNFYDSRTKWPLAFSPSMPYSFQMFETISAELKTATDKLSHLRRFL